MLAKFNGIIDKNKVRVTKLDIDNYGSIIALRELELKLPSTDGSIIEILKSAPYASIFTDSSASNVEEDENNSTIILANAVTLEELAQEKRKTIEAVNRK